MKGFLICNGCKYEEQVDKRKIVFIIKIQKTRGNKSGKCLTRKRDKLCGLQMDGRIMK